MQSTRHSVDEALLGIDGVAVLLQGVADGRAAPGIDGNDDALGAAPGLNRLPDSAVDSLVLRSGISLRDADDYDQEERQEDRGTDQFPTHGN